ncbi:MAG: DUF58 domain-containing protein [Acidobacteria bacterium]|nr:DUF58 domain-containing protein [Acidobacteriota bacterium]
MVRCQWSVATDDGRRTTDMIDFIFAKRFYWLLALGLIPLSLSWLNPKLVWAASIYDSLVLVAAAVDVWQTKSRDLIRIERHTERHFSLNAKNEVQLVVSNLSERPLALRLRDEYPQDMPSSVKEFDIVISPGQKTAMQYFLTPNSRGDFEFGRGVVRTLGRMRLIWRQVAFDLRQTVRVYPNFRQARNIELYAHRHRQMLVGMKRVRFRGHGREFESLRDFVTGDEIRHVAWTATARRGRMVTRQYQVERNQNLMIMLDTGRMMKAQVDRLSKLDHAINAALSLAYVALTGGDNVGLLIFGRQVQRYVPPRHRPDQLNTLLEALYNVEAELIEPNYARAFQYFTTRNKKRSLVVILTDVIDRESSGEMLTYTALLTSRHLPLIVTTSDMDLRALVQQNPTKTSDVYQQAIAEELLNQRREALALIISHGGLAIDVPFGDLAVEVVNQYLEIKEQGLL